jgi:hypothetical protein
MDSTIILDHCAVLNVVDDGFMQTRSDGDHAFDAYYCYFAGGPYWSGAGNHGAGSRDWHWHHCVMDCRIPLLWNPLGEGQGRQGVMPNVNSPGHSSGPLGPTYVRKIWNCTIIHAPDTHSHFSISQGPSPGGKTIPGGRAHEVYNCILAVIDNKRYPGHYPNDGVAYHLSCKAADAGINRYDYNCYWRDVPEPVDPLFREIQDSRQTNLEDFASLAAFRASDKASISASMYASAPGAFSGSDGTDGHEEHGVEVDPGFVDPQNRDYRVTHPMVKSGALDLSASGWPGATDPHDFKGAIDPNGAGCTVGPQNP